MTANDIQIGGNHYQKAYQHWDWVADNQIGYHAGNATKYIFRWRNKNGFQDLEKAGHYIDKMFELFKNGKLKNTSISVKGHKYQWAGHENTEAFIQTNELDGHQRKLINLLDGWDSMLHLREAQMILQEYVRAAREAAGGPSAAGATVTPTKASRATGAAKTGAAGGAGRTIGQAPASGPSTGVPKAQSVGGIEHPSPFGYDGDG